MREILLDKTKVNDETDCYVIAEIGHNHQGDIDKCKEIIQLAKNAGANAVKLQKRDNKMLYTKEFYNSVYSSPNSYSKTYGEHRDFLEFNQDQFLSIIEFCNSIDITFFCTAFDLSSLNFLEKINTPFYKIASGDITNTPLIQEVAKTKKPLIISSGGSTMDDIKRAFESANKFTNHISILQCTASYPAAYEHLNLNVISNLRETFPDVVIGYSGHDNGIVMPVVSYVLGGRIVEKHFTKDRTWKGTDQAFSLEPQGLEKMIRDLKRTRLAMGVFEKFPQDCEKEPIYKMSKKLVYSQNLLKGNILKLNDISIKSPGNGIYPYEIDKFIGKKLKIDVLEEQQLRHSDFEND